jgi:hypothetical protein
MTKNEKRYVRVMRMCIEEQKQMVICCKETGLVQKRAMQRCKRMIILNDKMALCHTEAMVNAQALLSDFMDKAKRV